MQPQADYHAVPPDHAQHAQYAQHALINAVGLPLLLAIYPFVELHEVLDILL
jgi:hypothetical protein